MKNLCKSLRLPLSLFIALLSVLSVSATTVIPPTFEEMTDQAELIFVGKVVKSHAEWRTLGTKQIIVTLVEFEKEDVLKGKAEASITLQFMGGTVGSVTLEVGDVPKFHLGDRELLFVEGNGIHFCPIVGVFHGKFTVRKDQNSGRDILFSHNGQNLHDIREIGMGPRAEFRPKQARVSMLAKPEPLSLEDFKLKIHARVARGGGRN